jgi:genome maintenance exonuclease 1
MFTHCDDFKESFKPIEQLNEGNVRYYKVEGDSCYPSITSVISFINRKKFADWRARVGNEEANRKCKKGTTRGTSFHLVNEYYINNDDYESLDDYQNPLIQLMFKANKSDLDNRIGTIYQQETRMYSDRLCLAGTVDLICDVDGELSIVDFKTSTQAKPEEWLEDYFVQLSAYWAMFSEKTGVVPKKLVVWLVGENGDVQIVERRNIMDYLKTLTNYVDQFIRYRDGKPRTQ